LLWWKLLFQRWSRIVSTRKPLFLDYAFRPRNIYRRGQHNINFNNSNTVITIQTKNFSSVLRPWRLENKIELRTIRVQLKYWCQEGLESETTVKCLRFRERGDLGKKSSNNWSTDENIIAVLYETCSPIVWKALLVITTGSALQVKSTERITNYRPNVFISVDTGHHTGSSVLHSPPTDDPIT